MPVYSWSAEFDPDEVKDYTVNWTNILDGDSISTSVWTIPSEATGLTESSEGINGANTYIWLSVTDVATNRSALAGKKFVLLNTITTSGGRTFQRMCKLHVKEQ